MEGRVRDDPVDVPAGGVSKRVAVCRLTGDVSVRVGGPDPEHVAVLAEVPEVLPPIVVHRVSMRVVDGVHRLRAARLHGDEFIDAVLVDGDDVDLLRMAVQMNSHHGLPLSRRDRRAVIARILQHRPDWSDRRIAAVAGVTHKTVGAVRRRSGGEFLHLNGDRDDLRARNRAEGRRRAAALIAQQPEASLRVIARQVGLSPATVMDVRHRLENGLGPVAGPDERAGSKDGPGGAGPGQDGSTRRAAPVVAAAVEDPERTLDVLRRDPSVRYTIVGRRLLVLLQDTVDLRPELLLRSLPVHSRTHVAALARAAAAAWSRFAAELETAGIPP